MHNFHHLSICNQHQSNSNVVFCQQNTKAIAFRFGKKCIIFITCQSAIKLNKFQFWSWVTIIPRLQPYFLPKNVSFSSLFNLQSKSINFKFGHFSTKCQGYSLSFWQKMPHFHHLSICNQHQSMSNLIIFQQNTKAIALLFGHKCLIFITVQSAIKINQFQIWSFVTNKTKAIAILFGQKCLIFITCQSAIKIIQFQFWSCVTKLRRLQPVFLARNASFSSLFTLQSTSINFKFGHYSPRYQGYSLTFWPNLPHFHHFSICSHNQSISNLVTFHQNTKAIASRLATNASFSSLFNLQAQSINFKFGHLSPKYQGYSLTFWPNLPYFHHLSICNQNQSISILVLFTTIPRLQPYFLATNASLSSLFNLQSKSINFNFGHLSLKYHGYSLTFWPKMHNFHHLSLCNQNHSISILVMCHQTTKAIALLFGQKCLIFLPCQSAIKINQFQIWSCFKKIPRLQPYFLAKPASFSSLINLQSTSIKFKSGHFSTKYQGYSVSFWHNMPHFHHFSLCSQHQSISNLVTFHQNTKAIASSLATNASFSSLFNLQSKSINFKFGHLSPKYQGHSLTFWPDMPYSHHFSICNQHQSISILVICHQYTKDINVLFGQKCPIFITYQSAIKINQFQIW